MSPLMSFRTVQPYGRFRRCLFHPQHHWEKYLVLEFAPFVGWSLKLGKSFENEIIEWLGVEGASKTV